MVWKLLNLNLKRNLPLGGIVAFSLCSTWSLFQLLTKSAAHPTPLFWLPAVLVELVTAWAVYHVVEQARMVTRSNISKQDRRFYGLMLGAFAVVVIPTLGASVWANSLEFGNVLLGVLFPVGSIGCAVGVALPDTMRRYERRKESEAAERKAERKARQAARKRAQEVDKRLSSLGKAGATFVILRQDPSQSQSSIAQALSISRQAVSQHFDKLEQAGAIKRNGGDAVEILWKFDGKQ